MDNSTRFWLCSEISQGRAVSDARAAFQAAKKVAPSQPKAIVHDGLHSYNEAFRREFYTRKAPQTKNIRSVSVRHEGLNSKVERLNNSVREREVVMRGMDHKESAQILLEGMRIYYDYARTHQALKGKTPAEAAGIRLEGNGNRIENLIRSAASADQCHLPSDR